MFILNFEAIAPLLVIPSTGRYYYAYKRWGAFHITCENSSWALIKVYCCNTSAQRFQFQYFKIPFSSLRFQCAHPRLRLCRAPLIYPNTPSSQQLKVVKRRQVANYIYIAILNCLAFIGTTISWILTISMRYYGILQHWKCRWAHSFAKTVYLDIEPDNGLSDKAQYVMMLILQPLVAIIATIVVLLWAYNNLSFAWSERRTQDGAAPPLSYTSAP